jgi:hypothetical protein
MESAMEELKVAERTRGAASGNEGRRFVWRKEMHECRKLLHEYERGLMHSVTGSLYG